MITIHSFLRLVFISEDEPRFRAGWRMILHGLLYLVLSILIGVTFSFLAISLNFILPTPNFVEILQSNKIILMILEVLTITFATWIARRFLDHRSFLDLGLEIKRSTWYDLGVGFMLSALLFSMIYLTNTIMGWSQFQSWAWESEHLGSVIGETIVILMWFLGVAYREELLSRGYHLQNLAQGTNLRLAVIISSLIFSTMHLSNPNFNWMAVIGLFAAGLFLAYGYIRTKALWLPIGLHLGWNFCEGTIFGFPVSGMKDFSLIQQKISGPDLITGGAFGPEASLLLFPTLLVGAYLIRLYSRKINH